MPKNDDTARYLHQSLKALVCSVLVVLAGSVAAQSGESAAELTPDIRPMSTVRASAFTILDVDGDGYLTRDEIEDPITRSQFSSLDRNRDGRLDRAEYSGSPQ